MSTIMHDFIMSGVLSPICLSFMLSSVQHAILLYT